MSLETDRREYRYAGLDVDSLAKDPHTQFKSWQDEDDVMSEYRIVGSDEIDADENWISIDSPIAQKLLGKTFNDKIEATTPSGLKRLTIINIRY